MNTESALLTIAQHYRDRGDRENCFDELKNQWGWGGFTTHDLHRCQFDGWFAFPVTIRRIHALGMHTVCMLKETGKVTYELEGCPHTLKELYGSVRKRCGRAKVLAEVEVTIGADEQGVPVPAKIVFVRDRQSKKWLVLLSTDTTLIAEDIIALYGRRWDIETFLKMAKSFLNLAKEFQSRSFDALAAHSTVVCCRYIMLELARRTANDPRTLGTLFHTVCDE